MRGTYPDYFQGVGGIGLPVFVHGVGGIGLPVFAASQGVGGIGLPVFVHGVGGIGLPVFADQGVGGIGLPVFVHGVGGIGLPVFAASQGVGGIGLPVLASEIWVVKALRPTALVKTSNTNTTTINHLFIDPPRESYRGESIGGVMPSREFSLGVCPNSTHPYLPSKARAFYFLTCYKVAFQCARGNSPKVPIFEPIYGRSGGSRGSIKIGIGALFGRSAGNLDSISSTREAKTYKANKCRTIISTNSAFRFFRAFEQVPRRIGQVDEVVKFTGTAQPQAAVDHDAFAIYVGGLFAQ